jgi:hypothetical protein
MFQLIGEHEIRFLFDFPLSLFYLGLELKYMEIRRILQHPITVNFHIIFQLTIQNHKAGDAT